MLSRTIRLVAVPATVTVLCGMTLPLSGPLTLRFRRATSAAEVSPAPIPKPALEIPRLIAVDKRIARRVNALRPCVKSRLTRVVEKLPRNVTLMVTSATRTKQEQAALRSTYGVKAAAGTSTHEDGRGVDVNVFVDGQRVRPRIQNQIIGPAMASEGFRHLGSIDPVHYSVPKEEVDTTLLHGLEMTLPTMRDFRQIKAEVAQLELASLQQKVAAAVDLNAQ